ncbi:hypothetical protein HCN44_010944 [Aphidius gifuensis]|uniref:Integrase SAM-like N-terminal domain-containing protein n=1 Tax=Aphidius gifuensis TaxID=684658 RepID=A0A834Y8V3_APHGI|nr:hypothetical protein HCN44_010944 [Aphidius gifuensis]
MTIKHSMKMIYQMTFVNKLMPSAQNLLPEKSKELYIQKYNEFIAWMKSRKINSMSEDVLMVYFNHLVVDTNIAPSTAWTRWSMIKSILQQYHNVDIGNYNKLKAFVKRYQKGYKPKKSEIFTAEDMKNFCEKADDRQHLADKIILIVGVFGGCRRHKIHDLVCDQIQDNGSKVLINIAKTEHYKERAFLITAKKPKIVRPLVERQMNINTGASTSKASTLSRVQHININPGINPSTSSPKILASSAVQYNRQSKKPNQD